MDDWSFLPRRNAVSEAAADPQTALSDRCHIAARLSPPRQASYTQMLWTAMKKKAAYLRG
jgi:hypothetical protein